MGDEISRATLAVWGGEDEQWEGRHPGAGRLQRRLRLPRCGSVARRGVGPRSRATSTAATPTRRCTPSRRRCACWRAPRPRRASPAAWRPSATRSSRCCRPATASSRSRTPTAARTSSSRSSCRGFSVEVTLCDTTDHEQIEAAIAQGCRVVYLETPTNPTLKVMDIARLAAAGTRAGAVVVADNTFATPINQNPLQLGADLVIHSATKFLGGHADALGGVVCGDADWSGASTTTARSPARRSTRWRPTCCCAG